MAQPLVSIIIPTYNRAHLIGETLDSVLAQTYSNWECIVVDDGSLDNTSNLLHDYCRKDSRIQYHHRPKDRPKGANACRNIGIELSNGEFIQFLDSDDILSSYCLMERILFFIENLELDILVKDTGFLIGKTFTNSSINLDPKGEKRESYLRMFLSYNIPWQMTSAMYSRRLLKRTLFDERLKRFQDVSLNIKILSEENNLKILRDKKIDSYYRVFEEKVITESYVRLLIESLIIFNEIHRNLLFNKLYKEDLRKFNLKFFNTYFLNRSKSISLQLFKLLRSYLTNDLFDSKQKIFLFFIYVFQLTSLINIKHIGMYRFRKKFNKVFQMQHDIKEYPV